MGAEAERFLQSNVGKYMVQRAEALRERGIAYITAVSPTDTAAIIEAQMQIRMADNFQQWIADLLQEGEEAERQVEILTEASD